MEANQAIRYASRVTKNPYDLFFIAGLIQDFSTGRRGIVECLDLLSQWDGAEVNTVEEEDKDIDKVMSIDEFRRKMGAQNVTVDFDDS